MSAPRPRRAAHQRRKPSRLALDDPAALAWGARLLQTAMERRRRRLGERKAGDRDDDA